MSKEKKEKIIFQQGPILMCGILTIIGILLIVISYLELSGYIAWWDSWGANTANALGTTVVASSVVSLVLEMSNIRNIFSRVLCNILNDEFPLNAYSSDNLEKFHIQLVAHLCEENVRPDQLSTGLYSYEKLIRNELTSIFYEYHTSKYFFTPDEKNGVFDVRAEVTYKVINKFKKENPIKFRIKTYCVTEKTAQEDYHNNFVIEKFTINDKEVDRSCVVTEDIPKHTYQSYYDYKIRIVKDLGTGKENTVKLVYEYKTPISDITQSYKITSPCKRLGHTFKIYPDKSTHQEWSLQASAFSAFYCKQESYESKFKVEQAVDDSVNINFESWALPGSGYVVVLKKR